ncbi:GRAM domain containing protein [Trema orientale]|uniref:GRAM domain containing protein n=1 Tax=Trema orientale TaxID=63057 RepID=A0A2P5BXW3_TREOI|nr:GRAM domain containing protein [Trema orientale]
MGYQFADQFNGSSTSPPSHSYDTTPERPTSSLSAPVSLCQSPSSSDGSSSFNTNEGESKKGQRKKFGRKSGSFTYRIRDHVKLGSKLSETIKGKLSLGAKVLKEGGRRNVFKQIFGVKEGEELLKASQCYLSTTGGPIAGLLFISTEKVAFCSERSVTFQSASGELIRTPYRVVIPVKKIKVANQSENVNKPAQKYIEIVTDDNYEFWFMGFLRYEKAYMNLEKALNMANQI